MQIQHLDEQTLVLAGLNRFLLDLLEEAPRDAEFSGDETVEARFFSTPTHGKDEQFDAEWRDYVEPDMRELFASAVDLLRADLENVQEEADSDRLNIVFPKAHLEPWLIALNQARIALGERHTVSEKEMNDAEFGPTPRGQVIFKIHFYGFLQECLLRELMEEE